MRFGSIKLPVFYKIKEEDKHYFVSFYFVLVISLVSISLFAYNNEHWFTIVSSSVVISIASFLVGALMGFIFGFPHAENEKQNRSFKDVTEWLTKIIIGLGLVELKTLYRLFNVNVVALSDSLGLDTNLSLLFGGLIIAYSIMGFLLGYCITVTEIFKRIVWFNKQVDDLRVKKILEQVPGQQVDIKVTSPAEAAESLIPESNLEELVSILEGMKDYKVFDNSELKKLAVVLYKAKHYELAIKAFETAYEKDKTDFFSLLNAGYILSKKLLRHDLANQLLDKLIADAPKYGGAFYNKACNYIRMNDFERAKENIKQALTYDATLYAMAEKDEELKPIHADIKKIFEEIRKN